MDDDNVIVVIKGRGHGGVPLVRWGCPVGAGECAVWLCMMLVVIEVGGGAWFLWMIAGGLIFRYRRPYLGGVHRV